MAFNPNTNPLFSSQWYLKNTGQRGEQGIDINVTQLWTEYTGRGVIVAVNDDGMDLTHPDLAANLLLGLTFDAARGTTGQGFAVSDNSHGTVVGGIIGMANNDTGGIGIAFDAKLVAGLSIAPKIGASSIDYATLFLANLASGAGVSCNSWGQDPAFGENFGTSGAATDQAWNAAMLRCVTEARDGLGMVIEVSGGNERANMADVALSNFTGARYTIAVGAMDHLGKVTSYSTPGASLLVSAPGGVSTVDQSTNSGFGILSTDIASDAGYNKTSGTAGDYAYQNEGTSYSGPMVAGVAALMLQANPKLGFRDVSTILAMTARQTDIGNASWVATSGSTWNLGGMHFSRDYGFGLVDAKAAVHLAESWNVAAGTVANWKSAEAVVTAGATTIPETSTGISLVAPMTADISIERMEVLMELDASAPSQLKATLTSPSGTTITLFDGPLTRELVDGAPNMSQPESAWPGIFSVGVTAFLGEQSLGNWTIALFDKVTGTTATFKSATVKAWGSESTPNTNLVFTDEFKGSKTLSDAGGLDTINAAAMTANVVINLNKDATSNLANGQFLIAADTLIENAVGGDGNDTLIGNAANNILRGNRGNDNINGGDGNDTLIGGEGNDTLDGGAGSDNMMGGDGDDLMIARSFSSQVANALGAEGNDTVTGGAGNDRLGLMGLQSNYTITATAGGARFTQISNGTTIEVANDVENVVFDTDGVFTTTGDQTTLTLSSLLAGGGGIPNPTQSKFDDFVVLQTASAAIVGANTGNDTYLISGSMVAAGQTLTISDSNGNNSVQLASGLSIASSKVTSNALQLTLSNGGTVTVLSADLFTYDVGGNTSAGIDNTDVGYASFVQSTLGVMLPSSGIANGGAKIIGQVSAKAEIPVSSKFDDFVVLQTASAAIVGANTGNDTYLISGSMVAAGQTLTISDSNGNNSVQLASGLSIASSKVTSNALQLTLSNGGTVTVLSADLFTYDVGGNTSAGIDNTDVGYASFVQSTLGVMLPSSGIANGGAKIIGQVSAMQIQYADAINSNVTLIGLNSPEVNAMSGDYM